MLNFSDEQIIVLEDEVYHRFLHRVIDHLDEYCADQCAHLPRDTKFAAARQGCDRARSFGIEEERGLILYTSLGVILGGSFDTDPCYPWARSMLGDPAYLDGAERMDDLWGVAMAYLDEIFEDDEATVSLPMLARYGEWIEARPTAIDVPAAIEILWPEKAALTAAEDLAALHRGSRELAEGYGLRGADEVARFSVMAFVLGHRFDVDPLYDWARAGLANAEEEPVMAKMEAACLTRVIESVAARQGG